MKPSPLSFIISLTLTFIFTFTFSVIAQAESRFTENQSYHFESKLESAKDWNQFQEAMEQLKKQNHNKGASYIITGTLVSLGSLVGLSQTNDIGTKLVYGLTSSAGIAAITFGINDLYNNENQFNSFYLSVLKSSLTSEQRNELTQNYLQTEAEAREQRDRVKMMAHFVAGALNVYSASQEKDESAKTFFYTLAVINFSFALTYNF